MSPRRLVAGARVVVGMGCQLFLAGAAQAHLLPAQNATMNIVDRAAYFVVSVPVSALHGVDLDGDGQLSPAEIDQRRDAISREFEARFRVSSDDAAGTNRLTWVLPPDDTAHESAYIVILHRVDFAAAPTHPLLTTDLFGSGNGEALLTMTATRAGTTEVAVITPAAASHVFFRSGGATFAAFMRLGLEHILGGFDHLLFLLTMVVAARGWRHSLAIVTTFTLAHSITLTLSLLGLIRLPPVVIEPAIAASIVAMALLNRRPVGRTAASAGHVRLLIVFACGLLHGLGFAAGVGLAALDRGNRLVTLAGFNLGIEAGQCAFLAAVLLSAWLWRRFKVPAGGPTVMRFASGFAATAGTVLLLARLYAAWESGR